VVPPALPKVGQPVTEGDLKQLKHDAVDPAHFDVTDDHHFEPPPEQMSKEVHVHCRVPDVEERVVRVLWGIDSAVLCVALLGERLTETGFKVLEELPCLAQRLKEDINHEHHVERHEAHESSPEDGVRSLDKGVWVLNRRECDKGERCSSASSI